MVAEEVFHRHRLRDSVLPHGNSLSSGIVVLGDLGAGQFIVIAHKVGGHAVDGLRIVGMSIFLARLAAEFAIRPSVKLLLCDHPTNRCIVIINRKDNFSSYIKQFNLTFSFRRHAFNN